MLAAEENHRNSLMKMNYVEAEVAGESHCDSIRKRKHAAAEAAKDDSDRDPKRLKGVLYSDSSYLCSRSGSDDCCDSGLPEFSGGIVDEVETEKNWDCRVAVSGCCSVGNNGGGLRKEKMGCINRSQIGAPFSGDQIRVVNSRAV